MLYKRKYKLKSLSRELDGYTYKSSGGASDIFTNNQNIIRINPFGTGVDNENEITIHKQLNNLRNTNQTDFSYGFPYLKSTDICYDDDGKKFMIYKMEDYGTTFEKFHINNINEVISILLQVVTAIAIAEKVYNFEHRDLHEKNILIKRTVPQNQLIGRLNNSDIVIYNEGVMVTIIDFGLSRTDASFCDIDATEPSLMLHGPRLYKSMKRLLGGNWSNSYIRTNMLWISYTVRGFLKQEKYNLSYNDKNRLKQFSDNCLHYKNALEALSDDIFSSHLKLQAFSRGQRGGSYSRLYDSQHL